MIKTYAYNDAVQIQPHFNTSEFRCKCGKKHAYKVDTELARGLESLFTEVPRLFGITVSKICLTSGYRCSSHDKAVRGSGVGAHVDGSAADFIAYDDAGKPISSKMISCAAQELGFRGIANITSDYIYTHCDMKDRRDANGNSYNWYGNEVYSNNTVTDNFWTYYGLSPKTNNTPAEVVKLNGIDVSLYQGDIDFKTASANIDFAVLRAGYGRFSYQIDKKFEQNYAGFKENNTPIGAYWYCYAASADEARNEAKACLEVLKGKQFELPIFYDVLEDDHIPKLQANGDVATLINEIIPAFCNTLEQNGYYVGVYCNTSGYNRYINDSNKQRYVQWCADWSGTCGYTGQKVMWQYSCKGSIPGISGDVDKDYAYSDFSIIKENGLNGWDAKNYQSNSDDTDKNPEDSAVQPKNVDTPDPEEAINIFEKLLKEVHEINQKLGR